jgi:tRNA uridine 5-carboxymethylaminomethyl modification enzyme
MSLDLPAVIVVGGGHAGLEASLAAARMGARVLMVTGQRGTIGQTPCNPSVGGVAKGHLVHEIVALGGFMGRAADAAAIHGKVLNTSKGPAVHSTRLQVDKDRYGKIARETIDAHPGVSLVEGMVERVEIDAAGRATGVRLTGGRLVEGRAVVVTTGTFLGGILHTGERQRPGGRVGEPPASALSQQLAALGFRLQRLKTGTPPRLDGRSIDFERLEGQPSDEPFPRFLPADEPDHPESLDHISCFITHTNERTHELIRENLSRSPMFSGQIKGIGPRYCPSIEDKVVRFADRSRHQIFLEPEGLHTHSVYPNGISTSLPSEVQEALVRSIAGLESARILQAGYAVEYDAVDARGLTHELASKNHGGLYFAGQINGTSGYEEAGIQGLLAGANAAASVLGRPPLHLARDQAYGGVLVDDLVTQGCDEPYRMFTSRAEYRLLLREDNADERLDELAFAHGLIDAQTHDRNLRRLEQVDACAAASPDARGGFSPAVRRKAHARSVYAGYLERQAREVERVRGSERSLPLPIDLDYVGLSGLTRECAERLAEVRPTSTGQAARIPGITPAAVAFLWAHARALQRVAE